jgi:hypothetical protein
LADVNVQALVQAMAQYPTSAANASTLSPHDRDQLQPVLAANWK